MHFHGFLVIAYFFHIFILVINCYKCNNIHVYQCLIQYQKQKHANHIIQNTAFQFDIFQPILICMSQNQQSLSLMIQKPTIQKERHKQIIKDYELLTSTSQNRLDIFMVVNKTYLHNLLTKRESPKISNDIKSNLGNNCIIFQNIQIGQQVKKFNKKLNQMKGHICFMLNLPIDLQIKIYLGKKSSLNCRNIFMVLHYKESGIWKIKNLNPLQNQKQDSFNFKFSCDSISDYSEPNLLMNISFRSQKQVNFQHAGIFNEGNTCYMNSFMQILFHLKPIRKLIVQSNSSNRLISALKNAFVELMNVQQNKVISIQNFIQSYQKFNQKPRRQQDVQQFMLHFINQLQQQFPEIKQFWEGDCTYVIKSKNPDKPYTSLNKEKYNQLDIHMTDTNGNFFKDIKQSLNSLIKEEQVQESIQNDQHGKIQVSKQRTFQILPSILFLNLKRYQYNRQKKKLTKILCPIKYQPYMNFSELISDVTPGNYQYIKDQQYVLYAVIVHKGDSPFSGHYFSFINTSQISQKPCWYQFNDSIVEKIDEKKVLEFTGTKTKEVVLQKNYEKFIETEVQSNQSSYLLVYIKQNQFTKFQSIKTKIPQQYLKQKLRMKAQAQKKNMTDVNLLVLRQDNIPMNFYENNIQNIMNIPLNLEDNLFEELHKIEQTYLGCKIQTIWRVNKHKKKIILIHPMKQRQITVKQVSQYRRGHRSCDYLLVVPKGYLHSKIKCNQNNIGLLKIDFNPEIKKTLQINKVILLPKNELQAFQASFDEKGFKTIFLNSKQDFMQDWNDCLQIKIVDEQEQYE